MPSAVPYIVAVLWIIGGFTFAAHRAETHPDGFCDRWLDRLDLFDLFG